MFLLQLLKLNEYFCSLAGASWTFQRWLRTTRWSKKRKVETWWVSGRFSTICQRGDAELVLTNMLMLTCWCTTTSLRWWRTCGVRSSCRWSTRGASRAPADLPFDRWPSCSAPNIVLRLRLRLPAASIPHLLRCLGVSLPPNGANSDSGEPTCLADIWRLPTVIYPFLYG